MTAVEQQVTETSPVFVWTPEEFIDAWEAGIFAGHKRVQMVDGEVWELGPIGSWHGETVARNMCLLRSPGTVVSGATLPMPRSMPDPDVWVRREGAQPLTDIRGYETWRPDDVLLVVEVGDSTLRHDLTTKATIYARGGVRHYWVVARDALHVFTQPGEDGYDQHEVLTAEDEIALPYGPREVIDVADLISGAGRG